MIRVEPSAPYPVKVTVTVEPTAIFDRLAIEGLKKVIDEIDTALLMPKHIRRARYRRQYKRRGAALR